MPWVVRVEARYLDVNPYDDPTAVGPLVGGGWYTTPHLAHAIEFDLIADARRMASRLVTVELAVVDRAAESIAPGGDHWVIHRRPGSPWRTARSA